MRSSVVDRVYVVQHKEYFDQPWVDRSRAMPLDEAWPMFELAETTQTCPVRLVSFPRVAPRGFGTMTVEVA